MKTVPQYKTLLLLLLVPFLSFSVNSAEKAKHEKRKTISKEYSVNSNATIEIDNSYGNLDVFTWNENRVVFEITITTSGNDAEKVEKKLEDINVIFDATSGKVSAKTVFNNSKSKSWWNWGKNNNVNMKINYVVKIPVTNNVNLSNDYGSINLDRLEGVAVLSCDYGKITTKELMADNNVLKFDYTQNSYFEYIKSGTIQADYSAFTVAKANQLKVAADYTKSKIELVEAIEFNCDYGGMNIEKANQIKGKGDYLTTLIGDVYKSVELSADYGSIKINRLNNNASKVLISSDYVGIKIGIASDYAFNFEIDLEYASLRDAEGFEFSTKNIQSSSKYYKGYYGNSNSGNTIKISSDYGSVSFFRN
ncbi:MAG TPA: hypothetical protein VFF15_10150 [Flavobacteriaceae bacterium]|nr:hypothetical protein [Flavobacteriaceae bacterium]